MAVTASRLRAVVSAETDAAQAKMRAFGKTVDDTARGTEHSLGRVASLVKGDLSGALAGLGGLGALAGVGAVAVGVAKVAVAMDDLRQRAQNVSRELTAYAGGAAQAQTATAALQRATEGGINKMEAQAAASRLLGMGLATTSDQIYSLARMAVMLGDKTLGAQERMSSFNAMLANQSIERLDTFGISSGRVRARIDEMMAATQGLTRDQAFVNAVLEIGGQKLQAVEAAGVDATSSMDKLRAALDNLKLAAAEKIHVSIVVDKTADVVDAIAKIMAGVQPETKAQFPVEAALREQQAAEAELNRLLADRKALQDQYNEAKARAVALGQQEPTWGDAALAQFDAQIQQAQAHLTTTKTALDEATIAAAGLGDVSFNVVSDLDAMSGALVRDVAWLREFKAAADSIQPVAVEHFGLSQLATGDTGKSKPTPVVGSKAWVEQETTRLRMVELQKQIDAQKRANTEVAKNAASAWGTEMRRQIQDFQSEFQSAMNEGIQNSIGLGNLLPGGEKGPNAPGANGAFESIYRLQAIAMHGTGGADEAKWAQMYGIDQAGAKDVVGKFQSGLWDETVTKFIDKDKLTQQIQQAQLGKTLMDAVAADLAKTSGGDPKLIKAMLGLGGGSDSATGATQIDLKGFIPGFLASVDKELVTNGADLEKRGKDLFDRLGGGFVKQASESGVFRAGVKAIIESILEDEL